MMTMDVILPALGMSQDTGKIVQWLKAEGEQVVKGEPLAEIETDKAVIDLEAPTDGVLIHVSAVAGDDVPVGQTIATIMAPEEVPAEYIGQRETQLASLSTSNTASESGSALPAPALPALDGSTNPSHPEVTRQHPLASSPLASRIAAQHNLDLAQVKATGRRIQKADVLNYLQKQKNTPADPATVRLTPASPKARRLAAEQGKNLATIKGTGPGGAVVAADVLHELVQVPLAPVAIDNVAPDTEKTAVAADEANPLAVSNTWRIMAERTTQSWTSTPHFYLVREVNASRLVAWREHILKRSSEKITYTDLLVKIVAVALHAHPRINSSWHGDEITLQQAIHVGLAVAIEEGLVVPIIHHADTLSLDDIARQRQALVARALAGKLRLEDISDGTFTVSNLGMYGVDAFNAIINQPQVAILAVGRIAERVVSVNGQPAVQPTIVLTLSCDHRAIDGARGAQFLATLAELIEEPLSLLN